ncbi:MAG: transposase [Pseudomonadales bacterium]|nr:transposase [Pseudomonadales bacterium]MBO6655459.1 transposase [Pseudomonadales bacterium]
MEWVTQSGAVTLIQRFGSRLNLNPHFYRFSGSPDT